METMDNWDFHDLRAATVKHQELTQQKIKAVEHKRDMEIEVKKAQADVDRSSLQLETVKQEMMNIKLYLNSLPR